MTVNAYEKEKAGYETRVDHHWHWLEGQREDSTGNLRWWSLYCFRKQDIIRARGTLTHLLRKKAAGELDKDDLDSFDDFRLRECGTPTDSVPGGDELRNPAGGFALVRALRNSAPRCGAKHPRTGFVCTREPGHEGKHKSQ